METNNKKFKELKDVKDFLARLNNPQHIGGAEKHNKIEDYETQITRTRNIISVCGMALFGLAESYGSTKAGDLHLYAPADLYDVIGCLEIADKLLDNNLALIVDELTEKL